MTSSRTPIAVGGAWVAPRPRYDDRVMRVSRLHGWRPKQVVTAEALAKRARKDGSLVESEWAQVRELRRDPNPDTRTLASTIPTSLERKPDQERGVQVVNVLEHPKRADLTRIAAQDPSEDVRATASEYPPW